LLLDTTHVSHIKFLNLRVLDLESPWKVIEFEANQGVETLYKLFSVV